MQVGYNQKVDVSKTASCKEELITKVTIQDTPYIGQNSWLTNKNEIMYLLNHENDGRGAASLTHVRPGDNHGFKLFIRELKEYDNIGLYILVLNWLLSKVALKSFQEMITLTII